MAKTDRRVQKTRQALQAALITLILERGYESLTVQDVLDHANVGRSTFYAHFYDLEDLLQSEFEVLQAEFEQHRAHHANEGSLWELSRLMFQHAHAYQSLYKAVVGKASERLIRANLQQYLSEQLRVRLKAEYGAIKHPFITLDLLEEHLVTSFMALLSYWLDKGLPYSAEEMAEIYQSLVKDGVEKLKGESEKEKVKRNLGAGD